MSTWLCILLFIVLPNVLLAVKVFGPGAVRSARYTAKYGEAGQRWPK